MGREVFCLKEYLLVGYDMRGGRRELDASETEVMAQVKNTCG